MICDFDGWRREKRVSQAKIAILIKNVLLFNILIKLWLIASSYSWDCVALSMKRNRFVSSVATAEEPQILISDIELVGLNSLGHLLIFYINKQTLFFKKLTPPLISPHNIDFISYLKASIVIAAMWLKTCRLILLYFIDFPARCHSRFVLLKSSSPALSVFNILLDLISYLSNILSSLSVGLNRDRNISLSELSLIAHNEIATELLYYHNIPQFTASATYRPPSRPIKTATETIWKCQFTLFLNFD